MIRRYFHLVWFLCALLLVGCNLFHQASSNLEIPSNQSLNLSERLTSLEIHEIQGAGHNSPYDGSFVVDVRGVITAIFAERFTMQSIHPDQDDATSEGIMVKLTGDKLNIGEFVSVDGKVKEYYPGGENGGGLSITQIQATKITVLASNQVPPTPQVVGLGGRIPPNKIVDDDQLQVFDPANDGLDFYESLESMLIQLNNPVAVAPTNQFGEIALVSDGGSNASVSSSTRGLILQQDDGNPEIILLDDEIQGTPLIKIGTQFSTIIGVIDYSFGNYKVQAVEPYFYQASDIEPEIIDNSCKGQLWVATYNINNLDGSDSELRFELLADQIVNHLNSPDLIALQEIQDNNGPSELQLVDSSETWQRIQAAILSIGGPAYDYRQIDPFPNADGGETGGNSRVGFLIRLDTGLKFIDRGKNSEERQTDIEMSPSGLHLTQSPGLISPHDQAFIDSRKPLIGEFEFLGEKFFVINLHLASKSGDSTLFGSIQPPLLKSEHQRNHQAEVIHKFVNSMLQMDPEVEIMVLGDMNDFSWSKPLQILDGGTLVDLVSILPIQEQFTYIHEGNSQALDHIFVTNELLPKVTNHDIVHINTILPYNEQLSDHDPQVICLQLGN